MAISYPLWKILKDNILYYQQEVAAEEALISSARNFLTTKDRWRPWIEAQQRVPLVNIMVQNVSQNSDRSGSRRSSLENVSVVLDMYALGEGGDITPDDEAAADRLDLLIAQVREGLTRLKENDLGFAPDNPVDINNPSGVTWADALGSRETILDRDLNFNLTYYDQENEQATGQYAPARWQFVVKLPFIPNDNNLYRNLEELNMSVKDETLEQYALKFTYDFS